MYEVQDADFDINDGNTDYFIVGKKVKIELTRHGAMSLQSMQKYWSSSR